MENKKTRIVFFGTSDTPVFSSLPFLEALFKAGYNIVKVVTLSPKPSGRKKELIPSPVKAKALELGLDVIEAARLKDIKENISESEPDVGVIAAFGRIIPKDILNIPKKGLINVHPSLLPRWRGPAPIQYTLMAGDKVTGVTIHVTADKVDAGNIIAKKEIAISDGEDYIKLKKRLEILGVETLLECLPDYLEKKITPQAQNEAAATYSKFIKTEDAKIDFSKPVETIYNQIRALNPDPGTFAFYNSKRIIISKAFMEKRDHNFEFGSISTEGNVLKIATLGGFIIPELIKFEGRKEIYSKAFLLGHSDIVGKVLK
ncbi:methionyl-tRNA formyltransferase [Candidatus Giovannonibacteria bacterium]|nr:methionyl-tRNA formyltransferase [Candidatus Giovannonibacteria bacterium]